MPRQTNRSKAASSRAAARRATLKRDTRETQIGLTLDVDGTGVFTGGVGVPFFEHMMNLFTRHALMDIDLQGRGDTEVDAHHTVEDVGIVLGQALKEALGERKGIARYGEASVPMEETLSTCVLDLCNRPYLRFDVALPKASIGNFDAELVEEFMRAFAFNAGITMHISVPYGGNLHHVAEAVFKSVGLALSRAVAPNPRVHGVFTTKGVF